MPHHAVTIQGLVSEVAFHRARVLAEAITAKHQRDVSFDVRPETEVDWACTLEEVKRLNPGKSSFAEPVVISVDGSILSNLDAFVRWANETFDVVDTRPYPLYKAITDEYYSEMRVNTGHEFVFLDVSVGGEPAGRFVFELFTDVAPKTCENFRALCQGTHKSAERGDALLTYAGSVFHRVQKLGWLQGGDIVGGAGDKGESIYGPTFEDESFAMKHSKRGILSMANTGIHTNNSQFFITFRALDWLDTKYVAFGQVIEGAGLLDKLEGVDTYNQRPVDDCVITACGVL